MPSSGDCTLAEKSGRCAKDPANQLAVSDLDQQRGFCWRDSARGMGPPLSPRTSFPERRFSDGHRAARGGGTRLGMDTLPSRGERRRWRDRRSAAAVRQDPFAWRLHLRLVVGGGLPATRPRVLPETDELRAAHAGCRPALAGRRWAGRRSHPAGAGRWRADAGQPLGCFFVACRAARRRRIEPAAGRRTIDQP
jgi:hypothetical protein